MGVQQEHVVPSGATGRLKEWSGDALRRLAVELERLRKAQCGLEVDQVHDGCVLVLSTTPSCA